MLPNARHMIHQPMVSRRSSYRYGNSSTRNSKNKSTINSNICATQYSGKSYNDFYGDMERDNFMNPDESLKYGLIDKIIDKRPE